MRVCNLGCQGHALFKLIIWQLPSDDNRLQVNVLEQKALQEKVVAGLQISWQISADWLTERCFLSFCETGAYGLAASPTSKACHLDPRLNTSSWEAWSRPRRTWRTSSAICLNR